MIRLLPVLALAALISAGPITVTSPNGGEKIMQGTDLTVTWTANTTVGDICIEISLDSGNTFVRLTETPLDTGTLTWTWTVPEEMEISGEMVSTLSAKCYIKVIDPYYPNPTGYDLSNQVFSIVVWDAAERSPLVSANPVKVFPNPANGAVLITLPSDYKGQMARIYDIQGALKAELPVVASTLTWNAKGLANGTYFLRAGNAAGRLIRKIELSR